jgi:hypothetical protein
VSPIRRDAESKSHTALDTAAVDNRTVITLPLLDNGAMSSRESSVSSGSERPTPRQPRILPTPPRGLHVAQQYSKSLMNLTSPPSSFDVLRLSDEALGESDSASDDDHDDDEDLDVIGPSLVSRLSVTAPGMLADKVLFHTGLNLDFNSVSNFHNAFD